MSVTVINNMEVAIHIFVHSQQKTETVRVGEKENIGLTAKQTQQGENRREGEEKVENFP